MRVRESLLRDLLRLAAWYPFRLVAERLPPRAALATFRALGDAHWALDAAKRRLLAENLGRMGIGPGETSRRAVRESFRTHYVSQLMVFIYPRLTRASLDGLVEFEGLEHLDEALRKGRGAVLTHAHFGPEQLALAALSLLGHRAMQVGWLNEEGLSRVGRGVSARLRRRYEAMIPGEILDVSAGLLPAFRVLRENGLVLCAGDGAGWTERLGEHVPIRFCGHTAHFPTGAARMALGSGAALLSLFVVRGRSRPFALAVEPPIAAATEADMAGEFARRFERRLLNEPGFMRFLELFAPGGLIEPETGEPGGTPQASRGPSAPS